jgi:hypothetical protein
MRELSGYKRRRLRILRLIAARIGAQMAVQSAPLHKRLQSKLYRAVAGGIRSNKTDAFSGLQ